MNKFLGVVALAIVLTAGILIGTQFGGAEENLSSTPQKVVRPTKKLQPIQRPTMMAKTIQPQKGDKSLQVTSKPGTGQLVIELPKDFW